MAKNINQAKVERQYKQKMLAMTGSLSHTLNIADQTMDLAEQFMTEEELSNSDAYRVLENVICACEDALRVLCNAIGKHPEGSSSIQGDRAYQSEEASVPHSPQTAERLEVLEQQRRNLLFLVCRILQAGPGYKLRPSELAAETVGDISYLSREARAFLYSQMVKENRVRTTIEGI